MFNIFDTCMPKPKLNDAQLFKKNNKRALNALEKQTNPVPPKARQAARNNTICKTFFNTEDNPPDLPFPLSTCCGGEMNLDTDEISTAAQQLDLLKQLQYGKQSLELCTEFHEEAQKLALSLILSEHITNAIDVLHTKHRELESKIQTAQHFLTTKVCWFTDLKSDGDRELDKRIAHIEKAISILETASSDLQLEQTRDHLRESVAGLHKSALHQTGIIFPNKSCEDGGIQPLAYLVVPTAYNAIVQYKNGRDIIERHHQFPKNPPPVSHKVRHISIALKTSYPYILENLAEKDRNQYFKPEDRSLDSMNTTDLMDEMRRLFPNCKDQIKENSKAWEILKVIRDHNKPTNGQSDKPIECNGVKIDPLTYDVTSIIKKSQQAVDSNTD